MQASRGGITIVLLVTGSIAVASTAACQARATDAGAPGEWTMPAKNAAAWRYSELDQITAANVKGLKVKWSFSTGIPRGHEGQPLVVGSMMYIQSPYPNTVYALDLTKEGAPMAWTYTPEQNPKATSVACCDWVNRGISYAGGKLVMTTLDGQVISLDAKTGKEIWKVRHTNVDIAETITAAPFIFKDRVVVGNSGAEFGVRGKVAAYDLNSGKRIWLCYNNGPDDEMCLGKEFNKANPHYGQFGLGLKSWKGESWKTGGCTVWGWTSYDPELDLVYVSNGNTSPWSSPSRADYEVHDNKWCDAIFARKLSTGEAVWGFQQTVLDQWDYAGIQENFLVDLDWKGKPTKALVHFDRNGYVFVLDRANGTLLSAEKFYAATNWSERIDLKTARPVKVKENSPYDYNKNYKNVCPSAMGAHNHPPAAYSPDTKLFYVPANNLCMDFEPVPVTYVPGAPHVGANVLSYPGPGGHGGEFFAWDAAKGKMVWSIKDKYPVWSGSMVTKGGVAFFGTLEGWFKAVDAKTGKELWKHKTGSGIIGAPISFMGPDKKQYVAVYSGVGGWVGLPLVGGLSPDDPYGALGSTNLSNVTKLWQATAPGSTLYVFALD